MKWRKKCEGQPERKIRSSTREAHQTHSGSLSRNPTSQKRMGANFNILKEKNFQPRISYPAKLSFLSEGKIKSIETSNYWGTSSPPDQPALQELLKEALNMKRNNQYHPLQNVPNGKDQWCNKEVRQLTGKKPIQYQNGRIKFTHTNINLKCKWAKCPNQKAQIGKLDKKSRTISMLYSGDPSHMQRHT